MGKGEENFNLMINNLFCDYSENMDNAQFYLNEINNLKTCCQTEEFYKTYILNLIYIKIEDYEIVLKNAKSCLDLYSNLTQDDKLNYISEYLFSRYYVIILTEYYNKYNQIKIDLEILKKEIEQQEENEILDDLIQKINLYLYSYSDGINIDLFKSVYDFNINDYTFFCEKTASKIIGHDVFESISHYTSINNSFDILRNKELWVTRYDFLNDKSELTYINDVLRDLVDDLQKETIDQYSQDEQSFLTSILKTVNDILLYFMGEKSYNNLNSKQKHLVDNFKFKHYFVLSFSKNHDSLSLWGNYTEFTGVNLLFDTEKLTKAFINKNQDHNDLKFFINQDSIINNEKTLFSTFYSGEVLYDINDIKTVLLKDFREALDLHIKCPKLIKEAVMVRIIIEIILLRRLFVKMHHFYCEEEYRFVFALDNDLYEEKIQFRCGKDSYIPFIKIPICLDNIKEIVVGPKNNSDLVVKGFTEYLNHNKLEINVRKSIIPFR